MNSQELGQLCGEERMLLSWPHTRHWGPVTQAQPPASTVPWAPDCGFPTKPVRRLYPRIKNHQVRMLSQLRTVHDYGEAGHRTLTRQRAALTQGPLQIHQQTERSSSHRRATRALCSASLAQNSLEVLIAAMPASSTGLCENSVRS